MSCFFPFYFFPFCGTCFFRHIVLFQHRGCFFFFTLCLFNCSFMFLSISVSSSFMNLLTYTFLEYWFSFNMALFLLFFFNSSCSFIILFTSHRIRLIFLDRLFIIDVYFCLFAALSTLCHCYLLFMYFFLIHHFPFFSFYFLTFKSSFISH